MRNLFRLAVVVPFRCFIVGQVKRLENIPKQETP